MSSLVLTAPHILHEEVHGLQKGFSSSWAFWALDSSYWVENTQDSTFEVRRGVGVGVGVENKTKGWKDRSHRGTVAPLATFLMQIL